MSSSDDKQAHAGDDREKQEPLGDLIDEIYGPVAPAPTRVSPSLLHRAVVARWGDASLETLRVAWGAAHGEGFVMQLMRPALADACPVIVSGDACWAYLTDDVVTAAARAGVALAWFNRTEVHADPPPEDRAAIDALLRTPPHGMAAVAAWAWALHRAVDVLADMHGIDTTRIAVAGHSRGGKAALLAAALDTRIALVAANNSGALGAASSFVGSTGRETVADLVRRFPHWVGPRLRDVVVHDGDAAAPRFDQHVLLAAIAPRGLLVTQAADDRWANPEGTRHAVEQAREAFAARCAGDALRLVERGGGHPQTTGDWLAVISQLTRPVRARVCAPTLGDGTDRRGRQGR